MNKIISSKVIITALFAIILNCTFGYSQSESNAIQNLISKKKSFNKNNKNSTIYKIQIYNGNETDAYKIKNSFDTQFPDFKTKVIYKSPEWKTQVGTYITRLEADRILSIIQNDFKGAIVLEDKI